MSRVGILYPGRLGAALGRALVQAGNAAIACTAERSEATRERAVDAGFLIVPSLADVVCHSDIVISLVSPIGAEETAHRFARCSDSMRPRDASAPPVFVDCNSVSPRTKERIAKLLSATGTSCVDGAFVGPANRVGPDNLLVLSGPGASGVAQLLDGAIEVRIVGPEIGQASALKMALAITTKALIAVFLEAVWAAESCGQLSTSLEVMRRLYPGIVNFVERSLPTYPAALTRRLDELQEVVQWQHELGRCPVMTRGAINVFERLRSAGLETCKGHSFDDLLLRIADVDI